MADLVAGAEEVCPGGATRERQRERLTGQRRRLFRHAARSQLHLRLLSAVLTPLRVGVLSGLVRVTFLGGRRVAARVGGCPLRLGGVSRLDERAQAQNPGRRRDADEACEAEPDECG